MADQGNVIAYKNLDKQTGDKKPAFTGKILMPGASAERGLSLWIHTSKKTGDIVLSGQIGLDANDQIQEMAKKPLDPDAAIKLAQTGDKSLDLEPNSVILFTNKRKAENEKQPDYFGYAHPGKGGETMRLSMWSRTDRRGNAYLSGSVQKYEPGKSKDAAGRDDDEDQDLDQDHEPDMDSSTEPDVDDERPRKRSGRSR